MDYDYGTNSDSIIEMSMIADYAERHLIEFNHAMDIITWRVAFMLYDDYERFQQN